MAPKNFFPPKKNIARIFIFENFLLRLVLFLVFFYLLYNIFIIFYPPQLKIIYPEGDIKVSSDFIIVEGVTSKNSEIIINNQSVFVNAGLFEQKVYLNEGLNEIKITAKKRYSKEVVVERKVIQEK